MQCKGAAEAVNAIVDNTTQCKFEATSPASDEVVLFNILQVSAWQTNGVPMVCSCFNPWPCNAAS